MKCKHIQENFPDYLTGELDKNSVQIIQEHIKSCSSCREEVESLTEIWTKLGVLPEEKPSNGLRNGFYSMLEDYKQEVEKEKQKSRLKELFSWWKEAVWMRRPAFQFGTALLLIVVGLVGGYFISTSAKSGGDIALLRQEVYSMRQMMAMSLIKEDSPSDRLRGISFTSQVNNPNEETLETLFTTLNNDPNVNVRLAAIDALYLFYRNPNVRENLVQSLSQQTSPLVQITLIDLIVEMRERRSIEALKTLIQDEQLNPDVKQRAELGIQRLS